MATQNEPFVVPCIQVEQPIGTFYIAAMDAKDLTEISVADRIRIEGDEREIETVSGLERRLSPKKVIEIRKYASSVDACFPTGIILAVSADNARYDDTSKTLTITRAKDVAKIIDGQHRIEGLTGYSNGKFQLNVAIFVDMDMEDQAIVFSTINLKQTPVAPSVAYALFSYAETRSPEKTCHNVARLLNWKEESPFHGRIMILGIATGKPNETLTQAAFIDPLLKYISRDPMADRDNIKRGIPLPALSPNEIRVTKLVFRNLFIQERDEEIARIIWNYFGAVSQKWPIAWLNRDVPGLVLNRTTGYRALMRFLPLAYLTLAHDSVVPTAEFKRIFDAVKLKDEEINSDNFKPGTSGQTALFRKLETDSHISEKAIWKGVTPAE